MVLVIWKLLKTSSYKALKKQKKTFFGNNRFSEGYTYRRTPTVNPFLCSFGGLANFIRLVVHEAGKIIIIKNKNRHYEALKNKMLYF